jgi:hypothetical protein
MRTLARLSLGFSPLDTKPPFVYQQIVEKAGELSRLGLSDNVARGARREEDEALTTRYGWSRPEAD